MERNTTRFPTCSERLICSNTVTVAPNAAAPTLACVQMEPKMGATGGKESATMPLVPAATFKIPQPMRARLHLHLSLSSYGSCMVVVLSGFC